MNFTIGNHSYQRDSFGIISQVNPEPFKYDSSYIDTYRSPQYLDNSRRLNEARLATVITAFGSTPQSILDFGYGDGSFLKVAKEQIETCYGHDVTGEKVPEGCIKAETIERVDVITFWDALEHCPNINFIRDLPCEMIALSLPCLQEEMLHDGRFEVWKHRKPNEHLHHFTPKALRLFFQHHGWKMISMHHVEDLVRRSDNSPNILTACFKR